MYKRTLSFLLVLCLILGMFPVVTMAAEADDTTELDSFLVTYINPLYADVVTEDDLNTAVTYSVVKDDVAYNVSIDEAGDYMRPLLADRTETITVAYTTDTFENTQEYADALAQEIFNNAIAHTGASDEGDYLMWQHGGWTCGVGGKSSGGTYYLTLEYKMTYYTDASQEAEVDAAVDALLDELIVSGMTDYQKLKAVYDWICANVTYDHANLEDESYKLKFTAYAALINKTAVCQGYALLLYRLALELGIDCRLIPGTAGGEAHGWNILELGDAYYNADSTWDAGETEYTYFLKSEADFPNHTRNDDYTSETFNQAYPMSQASYVPTAEDEADPEEGSGGGDNIGDDKDDYVVWTLDDGVMTISGSGAMDDYAKNTDTPWYKYADSITSVVIEEGITRIGSNAFAQCANLTGIQMAQSVAEIGEYALAYTGLTGVTFPESLAVLEGHAFQGCTALTAVTVPAAITKVNDMAFEGCSALTEVTLPEGVTALGQMAFANCTALSRIDFPASLTTIDSQALMGCTGLKEMYFISDAPSFISDEAFSGVTATAYYPAGNSTWTSAVLVNYGGTITWTFYCPNGHDYEPENRDVTCTESGGTYYICSACGDTFIQNETPALGHDYVDHVCTRCGDKEKVLPAPVATAENITSTGKIRVTWEAVEGAASYNVYYSTEKYDNYVLGANTTSTKLSHSSAKAGVTYYYCVTSVDENGKEFGDDFPEENIASAVCKLARPTITLGNEASTGKITISWEAVEDAAGYGVWRSVDGGKSYQELMTTEETSVIDTDTEAGVQYRYKVKALAENSEADSAFSAVKCRMCDLPHPTISLSNVESTGKIRLTWEAVEGAVKYQVFRSDDGGVNYTKVATTAKTAIGHSSAEAGKTYYYMVRAIAEETAANSAYSDYASCTCDLPQPKASVRTMAASGKIRLTWEAVEGAVKYQVYRSDDGGVNYAVVASTTKTSIVHNTAEAGKTYYYKIQALSENTDAHSACSAAVSEVCALPAPEVSITLNSDGKPVVTWEAVEGAVEYEVYQCNPKKGTYKLLITTSASGIIHTGAKVGQTCYYCVVALAPDDSWNSARSAKVFVPCVSVDITNSETMEAVVERINEYREHNGMEALEWYADGAIAARIRAAELRVDFSSTRPDGGTCEELMDTYDLYYELDLQVEPGTTAEEIVDAMMSDEDFADICMYEEFTYAVAACNDDCWAIMFGGENL